LYLEEGLGLPVEVLLALRNNGRISSYFSRVWFLHGVEYFIFKYVDSRLFVNTPAYVPRLSNYAAPTWGSLGKFYYPTRLNRPAKCPRFSCNILPPVSMFYEPTEFIVFINKYCPILVEVSFGKYATSSSASWYNRFILLINIFLFFVVNVVLNILSVLLNDIKKISSDTLLSATQFITSFSIFLLAVPVYIYRITLDFDFFINSVGVENLGAIQHGLYVSNPLLLLVSVNVLLVALISAAVIKGQKRKIIEGSN
jgi:hypothetical protein